ncbi:MAG: sodium/sugar symporter [Cyclobacteriaceae bacterium]|nr:sodium/sugar symporter [Cyclobacteriaceae bacterium]
MTFSNLDIIVFVGYCFLILFLGLFVSREKKGHQKDSKDYFLASKALPWWAVGASLIASNISAEQFIGMSGSGFAMGLAISTYEWMAAATLVIVGIFFLPIFLKKQIYTMPQFLEQRYDARVRTIMAIFWLLVYVFVNLTSVLYLGALSIETIMGIPMQTAIIGLAAFAMIYSIYGGLKAVAWTDVVQVAFLVGGGLATTYLALELVGDGSPWDGFTRLRREVPSHFHMIFDKGQFSIPDGQGGFRDAYLDLPGISLLIGGMWIVNLNYWGCNQYITQRALAAKNLNEAQKGVIFAGFLKLLMPLIVVIPGIAAFAIIQNEAGSGDFTTAMTDSATGFVKSDKAYPSLLNLLPQGLQGLAFAALTAAIVSSLASMANSTSTIFTMDIYKNFFNKNPKEVTLVRVGRIVALVAFVVAAVTAPALRTLDQVFQYIQEFTGLVSPGIFTIFVFGFFWPKGTANGAFWVAVLTLPLSFGFKLLTPELPFIDRMGVVFILTSLVMMGVSYFDNRHEFKLDNATIKRASIHFFIMLVLALGMLVAKNMGLDFYSAPGKTLVHLLAFEGFVFLITLLKPLKAFEKGIHYDKELFKTSAKFKVGAFSIALILVILYTVFW